MATRTDTQSPGLHVADRHDLIRVHGARVSNLNDRVAASPPASPVPPSPWTTVSMGRTFPPGAAAPGLIKPVDIQIIREGTPSPVIHRF
jgi:hypothetical protein